MRETAVSGHRPRKDNSATHAISGALGILYMSTGVAHGLGMDYNISDWVWDYLNENLKVLA